MLKDAAKGISPKDRELEERHKAQAQRRNSFGKVAAEFMDDHAKGLRTCDEMQRMLDRELLPAWSDRPIASITRAEVKALLRAKAQVAPIAANRLASLISKLFNWALDEEIVTASPAVRLKRTEEHERERSLSEDEIRVLWPALDRIGYPFGHALKLLLVAGQRRGEVADLKWSDLDQRWLVAPRRQCQVKGRSPRAAFNFGHGDHRVHARASASGSLWPAGGRRLMDGKTPKRASSSSWRIQSRRGESMICAEPWQRKCARSKSIGLRSPRF